MAFIGLDCKDKSVETFLQDGKHLHVRFSEIYKRN